jgi:dCTP deaminase
MIINKEQLLRAAPIKDMLTYKVREKGQPSYGLTECGYDIRIKQSIWLYLGRRFRLASAIEEFDMPNYLMGRVLNKSTWARLGVDASMTTNIEPGWKGFLTLELHYRKALPLHIPAGVGIAQVIFEQIAVPTRYEGKYQNQADEPVPAKMEM